MWGIHLNFLMLLLYISLAVKMDEEKVLKVLWVVYQLSYKRRGVCVILCFQKTDLFKAICHPNLLQNGPDIMHVMILFCATSLKGAMLICSDSTCSDST